ncbi:hypothetical protein [Paenibacillus humicus]|uniref:hypothetical protein n=1 Tax=Paenibacillus humicus TaxID=412861 RepID=UPI0013E33F06|nr:hypothetical protein [Paenibacillus humicus]
MPLHARADIVKHLQQLKAYRYSGVILEAAECWLDKEIADLEADLRKAGNAA